MTLRKWILLSVLFSMLTGCGGPWSSGDRVLVAKDAYDLGITGPHRYDVVVFKFPDGPMDKGVPKNYIKRLLGLPLEMIAIFFGRLYHWTPLPGDEPPYDDLKDGIVHPNDLHKKAYAHYQLHPAADEPNRAADATRIRHWFEEGVDKDTGKKRQFEILRKPPHTMLALRRLVYDNDYQAKDLKGKLDRWNPAPKSNWKTDKGTGFTFAESNAADRVDWMRYQHLFVARRSGDAPVTGKEKPILITDIMDYNSFETTNPIRSAPTPHWVGDLMLECNVEVVEPRGELWFELSKGVNRFRARWDLTSGDCTLFRVNQAGKIEELAKKPTRVKGAGSYQLRLANIDAALTVWVDRDLPFADDKGAKYDPPEIRAAGEKVSQADIEARRGPTDNDLEPASIGCKNANVKLSQVRLWRDTYYTTSASGADYDAKKEGREFWTDTKNWETLRKLQFTTMYVQPGHYLCLGDNSQASSDSRDWGLVPERLMLGRALMVYFPLERIGPIR